MADILLSSLDNTLIKPALANAGQQGCSDGRQETRGGQRSLVSGGSDLCPGLISD